MIQLYVDESWIYDGEISRYAWAAGEESSIQEKCRYRRWGIIGCLGCERDVVGEDEYEANQPPAKTGAHLANGKDGGLLPAALFQST